MSTCEKQVQPITARIITNEKGEKTYEATNPDHIGLLFLKYNKPFCLEYVKAEKEYDPYALVESFSWGKDEQKVIQETSVDTYVLNENVFNTMCQQVNKVITTTTNSVCNSSATTVSQFNNITIKGVRCCTSRPNPNKKCNCRIQLSQSNNAVLKIDNEFITKLTTEIKTSIKNEILAHINSSIDNDLMEKLVGNLDFKNNEDALAKIFSFIPKNKKVELENYINSSTTTENKVQNNVQCILEAITNTDTVNNIINNSISSVQQKNQIRLEDVEMAGDDENPIVFEQSNTIALLSQTLIESGLATTIMNDLIGTIDNLNEIKTTTIKTSEVSTITEAEKSDSVFGSTSTVTIVVIVIAIVVVAFIVMIVVKTIMSSGGSTKGGASINSSEYNQSLSDSANEFMNRFKNKIYGGITSSGEVLISDNTETDKMQNSTSDNTEDFYSSFKKSKDFTNFYLFLMSGIVILIIVVAIVLYTIEYIKKKQEEKKKQERNNAIITEQEKSQLRSIRQKIETFENNNEEINCETKFKKLVNIPRNKKSMKDYLTYEKTIKKLKEKCYECKNKDKKLKRKKKELEEELKEIQEEIIENKTGDAEDREKINKLQNIKNEIEEKYKNKENFGNNKGSSKFLYNMEYTEFKPYK